MPGVLVPSPFVAENHQERNARVLEKAGAAVVLLEKETTAQSLYDTVKNLLANPARLEKMGECAKTMAHHDALSHIYTTIKNIIG